MTKEEAKIIYISILDKRNEKAEQIIRKAKAEGRWAMGLDSNKVLFSKLDEETKKEIKKLCEQIDS